MKRIWAAVTAGLIGLSGFSAGAAHTRATLILSATTARPGETITAGVRLQMDAGWHTYWKNPGESGKATSIKWQLPPGIIAGEIQWPLPEKYAAEGLTTYVLHDEALLLVPLKLASDLKPGTLELKARVSWLECEKLCVPGNSDVTASLEVGSESKPSLDVELIKSWNKKLPRTAEGLGAGASWEKPASGDTRPLILEWTAPSSVNDADFFPYTGDNFDIQPATDNLSDRPRQIRFRKVVKRFEGDWPAKIRGVLVQTTDGETQGFVVELPIGDSAKPVPTGGESSPGDGRAPPQPTAGGAPVTKSLWQMLFYAFLGGLILNVMPCVLPVIALKILGFVGQAKESPSRVRRLGLIYAIGVLVSFLVLAGVVIGVKAAGHKAGWGMQFSNPQFIIGMTVLVTLVALNLFGLFEVTLGGRVIGAAGELASQQGAAGAFFNGVLATALATPCTAPFLSVALGFAFVQPASVIVLVFLSVGLGLAAPYVVLSWHPAWLKFLPKPGVWMENFKIIMGFPMLATAIWLMSLTNEHYGERAWWLGIFLVFVALAAWVFGAFVQRGSRRKGLAAAITILLLATGYVWALDANLQWRSPAGAVASADAPAKNAPKGYVWQRWSTQAVEQAWAKGRVVIVDFTAKWCITCNSIVKPALERQAVVDKLNEVKAVALVADYTSFQPEITEELARFDRAGVPLVLVYPKSASEPPMVLPDPNPLLGPGHYAGLVLDALQRASR